VAEPTRQDEPKRGDTLRPHAPLTSWYGIDSERERRRYVDDLFNKSARHYDTVEKIFLNGGLLYRRTSMRLAGMRPGMKVLDIATGTGAVARGAARNVGPTGAVFGCDPNRGMLREARKSFAGPLTRGVAQALPFASGTFDFVTMGIALRHVSDLKATFHEYCRVLKPGGRLWILESHVAKSRVGYALTRFTWKTAIPGLTYLFTRDRDAKELMDYYWDTVDQCVEPAIIVAALRESGFEAARSRVTLPGAFCEYTATRPPGG
jgi:demethylmenaquinone methyltransferase/2-methoxy-6-polyprenyl-1,4-benzoquinol methylase